MTHSHIVLPSLNFFGSTIQEEDRDIFAGHVFHQTEEAEFPGRRIGMASLSMPRLPVIEVQKKKAGRPKKTPEDITFFAHCRMIEALSAPETLKAEVRGAALQLVFGINSREAAMEMARAQERGLQKKIERAEKEIAGLRTGRCMSRAEQTGFWMAIEHPPGERNGTLVIDSNGWLCFAGRCAEYGRIKLAAGGHWAEK